MERIDLESPLAQGRNRNNHNNTAGGKMDDKNNSGGGDGGDVVHNKNVPGNGLTDTVVIPPSHSEEMEPLQKPRYPTPVMKKFDEEDGEDDHQSYEDDKEDFYTACARRCRLNPKKSLIYIGVSWTIIFILLLILIIGVACWPWGSARDICETSECLAISSKIVDGMNRTTKPCDDFWQFSCGGWFHKNPIPLSKGEWSKDLLDQLKIKNKIRTLINTEEITPESNSIEVKIRTFYQSCMTVQYVEVDQDKPLKKSINEMGGWEALRSFRQSDFDFPRVLRKLHSEHRISPYFHVEVVPDPYAPSKNIIKISPAGLSLPHKYFYKNNIKHALDELKQEAVVACSPRCEEVLQKLYFEHRKSMETLFRTYVKDVIQHLGAASNIASQQAEILFNYERRIAEVTPDWFVLNISNPTHEYTKIRVDKLNSMSASIFWADLLKAMFPQGHVNDYTEVLVVSEKYLKDVSEIISSSDKTTLNNYLMWQLAMNYLPYLSKQFSEVHELFRRESTGSKEATPRWEFCIDETFRLFSPVINWMLANSCDRRAEKVGKVQAMFDTIKKSLSERIQESPRFEDKLRTWAIDKLRLMTIEVGAVLRNKNTLMDLYHSLSIQPTEFFWNVYYTKVFTLQLDQKDLAIPNKNSTIAAHIAKNPYKIQYIPTLNKVIFPEAALQADDFLLKDQMALLYGSIGVQFGEILASALGPTLGLHLADGTIMATTDPKFEESAALIEQKRSCLASFFTKINLDDEPYIQQTSLETTFHLAGIEIALDTFQSISSTTSGLGPGLPSLQTYSPKAIFFLSYGQSQCSSTTLAFHDLEHSTSNSLTHEHRVRGVLRQLGAFTEAFTCRKDTEMYADFQCGYVL